MNNHAVVAFGGILTLLGAVSTAMGPIALAAGAKEIRLGKKRLLEDAWLSPPLPNLVSLGNGNFGPGLGVTLRF
jgi:hypothetical protein